MQPFIFLCSDAPQCLVQFIVTFNTVCKSYWLSWKITTVISCRWVFSVHLLPKTWARSINPVCGNKFVKLKTPKSAIDDLLISLLSLGMIKQVIPLDVFYSFHCYCVGCEVVLEENEGLEVRQGRGRVLSLLCGCLYFNGILSFGRLCLFICLALSQDACDPRCLSFCLCLSWERPPKLTHTLSLIHCGCCGHHILYPSGLPYPLKS